MRQREKKCSKLSLVKVNPEIQKLRKEQFKLKSKFEITEKILQVLNSMTMHKCALLACHGPLESAILLAAESALLTYC